MRVRQLSVDIGARHLSGLSNRSLELALDEFLQHLELLSLIGWQWLIELLFVLGIGRARRCLEPVGTRSLQSFVRDDVVDDLIRSLGLGKRALSVYIRISDKGKGRWLDVMDRHQKEGQLTMRAPTRFSTRSPPRSRSGFALANCASEMAVCCSRIERRVKLGWLRAPGVVCVASSSLRRLWGRCAW